jgi:hypothetical protein
MTTARSGGLRGCCRRCHHRGELAGSLNNLSVMLSDVGLQRDALAASIHAVDIRR